MAQRVRQAVGAGDYCLIPVYQLSHLPVLDHKGYAWLVIKKKKRACNHRHLSACINNNNLAIK